jgi:hypothetical protein
MPGEGLEPPRPFGQPILNRQRLPFRHPGVGGTLAPGREGEAVSDWTKEPVRPQGESLIRNFLGCSVFLSIRRTWKPRL